MPWSPLKIKRRFGGSRRLHLLGWRINHGRNQRKAGTKLQHVSPNLRFLSMDHMAHLNSSWPPPSEPEILLVQGITRIADEKLIISCIKTIIQKEYLLGCNAILPGRCPLPFRRNVLPDLRSNTSLRNVGVYDYTASHPLKHGSSTLPYEQHISQRMKVRGFLQLPLSNVTVHCSDSKRKEIKCGK
jgi:hypothetical protein